MIKYAHQSQLTMSPYKELPNTGASNLFQPRAKFAVPKVWRAKIYSLSIFLPKSR